MTSDVIRLENIYKNYYLGKVEVPVLKGIHLQIAQNEYVALMGPSGSGKSTLMNILGCLDTVSKGNYFLNGSDVSRLSDNELAVIRNKSIGFVFQTFNLMPRMTALENAALPLVYAGYNHADRIKRAKEMMDAVGLADRMHHRPNELSGGQKQRVAIARALVNNPGIILADEPTGNLDSENGAIILALLRDLNRDLGLTILMATHSTETAAIAGRLLMMRDGVLLAGQ